MLADPIRGVNYELSIALAPPATQLLLLSGSVANPREVADWLSRIGRDAILISHKDRPVPLTDIDLLTLPETAARITSFWPRMLTNALRASLGPILVFAPRRNAAEDLALALAAALTASLAQAQTVGSDLKGAGHDTAHASKTVAHKTANGTKKVYHKTVHGTKVGADKTVDVSKTVGKDTGHGVKVGADKTADVSKKGYHGTVNGTKKLGHKLKPKHHSSDEQ